jgi:hypothetical protein
VRRPCAARRAPASAGSAGGGSSPRVSRAISGTTTSTTTKAAASAATTVYARDLFAAQDVRFGQEYEDIIWIDGHGLRRLDYSKIDSTRPAPAPVESSDSAR